MFGAAFFELYKLYLVASTSFAVAAKTTVSICLWINLQAGVFIIVEGAN
jgi:hypothetical protein